MILRKYILIFTLALISCAGTHYIQSLSGQKIIGIEDQKCMQEEIGIEKIDLVKLSEIVCSGNSIPLM